MNLDIKTHKFSELEINQIKAIKILYPKCTHLVKLYGGEIQVSWNYEKQNEGNISFLIGDYVDLTINTISFDLPYFELPSIPNSTLIDVTEFLEKYNTREELKLC